MSMCFTDMETAFNSIKRKHGEYYKERNIKDHKGYKVYMKIQKKKRNVTNRHAK